MANDSQESVTRLLLAWKAGDQHALEKMMPLVYDELQRMARRFLRSERPGHTLQTTALVNEAYLKLVKAEVAWKDRVHFYAVASRCMRRILVDHARAHRSAKRGGGKEKLPLDEALAVSAEPSSALLTIRLQVHLIY